MANAVDQCEDVVQTGAKSDGKMLCKLRQSSFCWLPEKVCVFFLCARSSRN